MRTPRDPPRLQGAVSDRSGPEGRGRLSAARARRPREGPARGRPRRRGLQVGGSNRQPRAMAVWRRRPRAGLAARRQAGPERRRIDERVEAVGWLREAPGQEQRATAIRGTGSEECPSRATATPTPYVWAPGAKRGTGAAASSPGHRPAWRRPFGERGDCRARRSSLTSVR